MEKKKSNRTNLDNKKVIFLQIGIIVSLSLCLLAFEWRSYESYIYAKPSTDWLEVDELLPVNTEQRKLPPPPAVKPVYTINIVENTALVIDDLPPVDVSFNENWQNPDVIPLPEEVSDPAEDTIYSPYSLEVQPEFPGGEAALYEYLGMNIKYPKIALEAGIQGTVYIGFVIEKDGSLTDIGIVRSPDQSLSNETSRVVSGMPDWIPGRQGGLPVRVSFRLPVKFKIQ
jgi:protein TonB